MITIKSTTLQDNNPVEQVIEAITTDYLTITDTESSKQFYLAANRLISIIEKEKVVKVQKIYPSTR